MHDEGLRNVAADSMAQGFIVEILLTNYFKSFPPEVRDSLAKTIIAVGKKTDHFAGLIENEAEAEVFSDVVVKMHAALESLVQRSLLRLAAGEAGQG
jgi:hypothetical protein